MCVGGWLAAFTRRTDGGERREGLERRMQIVQFYRTTQAKPEAMSCGGKIRLCTEEGRNRIE